MKENRSYTRDEKDKDKDKGYIILDNFGNSMEYFKCNGLKDFHHMQVFGNKSDYIDRTRS